jgi:hypothetical protein
LALKRDRVAPVAAATVRRHDRAMRLIGKITVTVAAALLLTAPTASADIHAGVAGFDIPTKTINLVTGFFDDPIKADIDLFGGQ